MGGKGPDGLTGDIWCGARVRFLVGPHDQHTNYIISCRAAPRLAVGQTHFRRVRKLERVSKLPFACM